MTLISKQGEATGKKKMGRPVTGYPQNTFLKIRLDCETAHKLARYSEELKVPKAEVLRRGVHKMYDTLKQQGGAV